MAARFIMQRVPGVKVTPYFGKIQDKDDEYYMQFNIIVAGLDSIEARRWLNAKIVSMVDEENPESLKPLLDGGTEGKWSNCAGARIKTLIRIPTTGRLCRTSKSNFANYYSMLRVRTQLTCTSSNISDLYNPKYTKVARTLHRMGFRT